MADFVLSTASRPALKSTQPPIQLVPWNIFSEVKRKKREADHSSLTSAGVKNWWSYISTPQVSS
jgi:hypothetical protein